MGKCKAAGVIHTRTLLRAKGDKVEQAFLEHLTQEETDYYFNAMPVSMLPLEIAMKLYRVSVSYIYTGCKLNDGLSMLAADTARNDINGIYKILVRFVSPETIIKQTAKIWKTYHSKGTAYSEHLSAKSGQFILTEYPDTPEGFEYIMDGFIIGTLSLSNFKNIQVQHDLTDRNAMKWLVTWE